jgi:hypothetical protein
MPHRLHLSRRTCLKALGVTVALPLLETMAVAGTPAGAAKSPVRLGFFYHPLGVLADAFWPKDPKAFTPTGALSPCLEPLRPVVGDCLLIDRLDNPHCNDNKASTHLVETSAWLTCASPVGGGLVNVGVSADQVAAQQLGAFTVLPSLELGVQGCTLSGTGEGGYALAYYQTIAYRSATQPLPSDSNPRSVFSRLFSSRRSVPKRRGGPAVDAGKFAGGGGADEAGPSLDQSMLDLVMDGMGTLRTHVSSADQRTLDQYYDGVRSLEKRVVAIERQQAEAAKARTGTVAPRVGKYTDPIAVPLPPGEVTWSDHVKVMADLMILAFQTDLTRVATMPFSLPGGINYPELGFAENHHDLTHDSANPDKRAKLIKLEQFIISQFTYIVQRMKSLSDGSGTLLDNSILLWGSGMGDGGKHNNDHLPTILAGRGGGTIRPGRQITAAGVQGDLLMAMLARAGCTLEKPIGSGTKLLPDLA